MRSDVDYEVLGWIDGKLMLYKSRGNEYFIQAYSEDMLLQWERPLPVSDKRADVFDVIGDGDHFHVIYGVRNKGDFQLMHSVFDPAINVIDTITIGKCLSTFLSPRIRVKRSENRNQLLFIQDEGQSTRFWSYNLDQKQLNWVQDIRLNEFKVRKEFSQTLISDSGDFYGIFQPEGFFQNVTSLDLFYSSSNAITHSHLELEGMQVYDYYLTFDNHNEDAIASGLYSEKNISRAQGFYFARVHPGKENRVSLIPFDGALLEEIHGREVAPTKGLADFTVQQVALRQDGGAVIIAELNKEFSRRSSMPMRRDLPAYTQGGEWVDYYFEDLILLSVHPDGSEHWRKVLRKKQYSQDDNARYSSFFLFRTPERLRFLFNDEIKHENTVGGYEVTGTGDIERKTIFNTDYQRLKMRFRDGEQVAYNECIVMSERSNRLNMVRIQFEE